MRTCFLVFLLLFTSPAIRAETNWSTQLNVDTIANDADPSVATGTLRVLPDVRGSFPSNNISFDYQLTGDLWTHVLAVEQQSAEREHDSEFHRLWLRISTESTEARLGLQKLNFGPAKILRTLRWFDQRDPMDPTGYTKGVRGLLLRQYFDNNANLWFWSLSHNKEPTGPIPLHSDPNIPEYGGRLQYPIATGELALTAHTRRLDANALPTFPTPGPGDSPREQRIALDGAWDVGAGVWFEACTTSFAGNHTLPDRFILGTVGMDYTFAIGNGLYSALEFMGANSRWNDADLVLDAYLYSLNQSYGLGLLDQLQWFVVGCFECDSVSATFNWQRTWDAWLLNVGLFGQRSEDGASPFGPDQGAVGEQKGLRITTQVNF